MKINNKRIIFKEILKFGKYYNIYPIIAVLKVIKIKNRNPCSIYLIGTLVRKKIIKKSVKRNKIKRLLKSSFLEQKNTFYMNKKYDFFIIFIYTVTYIASYKKINISIRRFFNFIINNY